MDDDPLLTNQIAYYRARADEYDEWWRREGRYDKGDEFESAWRAEVEEVVGWLDAFGPTGDVLELAGGTGNWTVELRRHADRLTVVDASPETLAHNRAKLAALPDPSPVDYVVADLFGWDPPRRFDHVFFSFWLSHVPDDRLPAFFDLVDRALAPGGRVAIVDNRSGERAEAGVVEAPTAVDREGLSTRSLNDGREFTIVKVFRSPERLAELLDPLGWAVSGRDTARFFTWAELHRR